MTTVSIGIVLVKISVCLFLLRLATTQAQTGFLWGIVYFLVPFALAGLGTLVCQLWWLTIKRTLLTCGLQVFQCSPVAAAWDIDLQPPPIGTGTAKCFSGDTFDAIGLFNGSAYPCLYQE